MQYKTFGELHRHIRKNILKKNLRQFRGVLFQLIERGYTPSGIGIAHISQIERDLTKPSVEFQEKSIEAFSIYRVPPKLIKELTVLGDMARGKLSLQDMDMRKKLILVQMASMKLTQTQIKQLNDLLKEFENEQR